MEEGYLQERFKLSCGFNQLRGGNRFIIVHLSKEPERSPGWEGFSVGGAFEEQVLYPSL